MLGVSAIFVQDKRDQSRKTTQFFLHRDTTLESPPLNATGKLVRDPLPRTNELKRLVHQLGLWVASQEVAVDMAHDERRVLSRYNARHEHCVRAPCRPP